MTVEAGGETFEARAKVTERQERESLVALNPQFTNVQARTTRVIPVVMLERIG